MNHSVDPRLRTYAINQRFFSADVLPVNVSISIRYRLGKKQNLIINFTIRKTELRENILFESKLA